MPGFDLKIESNADEVADLMSEIGDKILRDAEIGAINKTLTQERTQIRREIRADTGIPVKIIGKRVKLKRANRRRRVGRIFIGTYNVKVADLKPRQLRSGVSYSGRGGRVRKEGAFVATMKSGRTGAFIRKGKARLPIKELSVSILPAARSAARNTKRRMPARFNRLFAQEFNFRTGRAIKRRRLNTTR